jgi:hypothetical protein
MLELTKKYFSQDLTEDEEQALSEALRDSPDEAEDFGKMAEEAYYRYGFSRPLWPGSPENPAGGRSGFRPWMGLLILALGGAAAFWMWNSHRIDSIVRSSSAGIRKETSPAPHPHSNLSKGQLAALSSFPVKRESNTETRQAFPGKGPGEGKVPSTTEGVSGSRVPEGSMLTPINLEEAPSRPYSSLSMRVNLAEPVSLIVRVVDMRGLEVTPLYQGNLGAGHWIFEWNGKLANGGHASKGYYQIEVRAGSVVQRKNLEIR